MPATGSARVVSRGLMVAGIALGIDGRLIVAGETGLHVWRGQDDHTVLLSEYDGETLCFNDIVADARGRIYAGTLYWGADGMEKHGKLYLVDVDGVARVVDEGIKHANGLAFSPDGGTLYFADTATRVIYAYDVEPIGGSLSRRRVVVEVPVDEGLPDGLTVDQDGFVWSAHWYGGQVVRYDPDGKVERRILFPATQTSSLAFGGPNMTDLYVTSAAAPWRSDFAPPGYDFESPNTGGSLYRVRIDVAGRPEYRARVGS